MPPTDDPLLPLVDAMARGDRDALRRFVEQVGPWIHAAQLRLTSSSVAAAVLTERTLTEIWTTAPLYDRDYGPPLVWALAVARAHGLAYADERRGKEGRLKSRPDAAELLQHADEPPDPRATEALRELTGLQRQVLVDAWFEGLAGGSKGGPTREQFDVALPALVDALAQLDSRRSATSRGDDRTAPATSEEGGG